MQIHATRTFLTLLLLAPAASAGDWNNAGGNAGRNGLTPEVGPETSTEIWSGSRSSIIAWQPVIEGFRVFQVRQTSFPPESGGSPIVCQDLNTGVELWAAHLPANSGDWTAWVAGVKDGRVYASRSGNGASVSARMYCLDAASGNVLWFSNDLQDAGAYDGVVFAPNGDPVVASFQDIWRFDHLTGATVWHTTRVGSVSGECGGAIGGSALYVADAVVGGHAIKKFDLATGAFQYQGPTMAGFTIQTTPMVGPDGTIYLSRVQNNASVDFFYAFADTGTAIVQKWFRPAGYTYASEFGVGPDGSVYHITPAFAIDRLDPATGATVSTSGPLPDVGAPRMGVDAMGRVFFSNGGFAMGRVWSFNEDLTIRWTLPVQNVNIGAPAIGRDGTLIVSGVGTNVKAYRTTPSFQVPYCFGDGTGTPCPCANNGSPGHGCGSSVNAAGAELIAIGAPRMTNDTFQLHCAGMPDSSALFFQGTTQLAGTPFGDGLRCAGGSIIRLGIKFVSGGATHYPMPGDLPISLRGLVPGAGSVRTYQCWYRNADASFCTPDTFNLSNGLSVTWQP